MTPLKVQNSGLIKNISSHPATLIKYLLVILLFSSLFFSKVYSLTTANRTKLLTQILTQAGQYQTLSSRLNYFSALFLTKHYAYDSLGEGHQGSYDQRPRYRFDKFDCQTYVETVLALSLAKDPQQFKKIIDHIRYQDSHVSFINRHHFPSSDWIIANQKVGLIKNINTTLAPHHIAYATTYIDKKNWIKNISSNRIHLINRTEKIHDETLKKLRSLGHQFNNINASISYIPLSVILSKKQATQGFPILQKLPILSIVFIVKPNWHPKVLHGTKMNVSHMGFIIRHNNTLYFRHASTVQKKIVDINLLHYLTTSLRQAKNRKIGLSIYKVRKVNLG